MSIRTSDSADDPMDYVWSLARMCYVAQVSLWRHEGEALEASDSDRAEQFRGFQIALHSSAIQIHSAEVALAREGSPDAALVEALARAEADVRAALAKLESRETAIEGAEALIEALVTLESVGAVR